VRPYTGGFRARVRAGCADSVSGARRWLAYTGGFRARVCGRVATLLLSLAVRPYKGVFPALIRVHRVGRRARGAHAFLPSPPTPLPQRGRGEPHAVPFGVLKRSFSVGGSFVSALHNPPRQPAGEGDKADKGTSVRHGIAEAGVIFPARA